jgi:hypothetical protein
MLVLMAAVAATCCYALLPWANAKRFVAAVRQGGGCVAPGQLECDVAGVHLAALSGSYALRIEPLSLAALWRGEVMIVVDGLPAGADMPGGTYFLATRTGVKPGPMPR